MKKSGFWILIFFLSVFSCNDEDKISDVCNVDDPATDVEWIRELINSLEANENHSQIILYQYKFKTAFLVDPCHQCPDALAVVYDCDHNVICEFGGIAGLNTCPDFSNRAVYIDTLFSK